MEEEFIGAVGVELITARCGFLQAGFDARADSRSLAEGKKQVFPGVKSFAFEEGRGPPGRPKPIPPPGIFRRDEQARVINRLQKVTHIPWAPPGENGRAISIGFRFFGGFFQAEEEPIGRGDRDRYRALPVSNLAGEMGQLRRLTLQNRGRRPQGMKPLVVKAIEGGWLSQEFASVGRGWYEADCFRCRCANKGIDHHADEIGEEKPRRYLRRGFHGGSLPSISPG